MNKEIDYQKVFQTLDFLVDRSVNYHSYDELTRHAYHKIAYYYKVAVKSLEDEMNVYNRDPKWLKRDVWMFNKYLSDYELKNKCDYYFPWEEIEIEPIKGPK